MLEAMIKQLNQHLSFLKTNAWIFEIFIVMTVAMLLAYVINLGVKKLIIPRVEKSKNFWDESFVKALNKPLSVLIWLVGLGVALEIANYNGKYTEVFSILAPMKSLGIIAVMTWFVMRFINEVEKNIITHDHGDKAIDTTTVYAVGKIVKASAIITAILVALQTLGIGISGVLAFGGIGGAAIAFSAKDLLANFFGGLIIYLDRPFAVGDWIRSPDRQIEGTVEYIGWRLCRIRTFDKRPLYVPNSIFNTISIENPSRMTNRRIKTNIGLRYEDAGKLATILSDIENMLRNHSEIDTSQTLMVNLVEFGPSSLDFMVYTFTKTTKWVKFQAIQQDVFLKIIEIILNHGAECAFPNMTMHIPDGVKLEQVQKIRADVSEFETAKI